ncbi:SGNH/GDSL hydrolase family protein [Streptomyces sp. HUAS TT7]|uniref:SGNH/GDSL hydrolase family protein n=1 Tax=Streptomyces sp. HUAS TT7 TaxID=3447507 RepID=UPI003F65EC37
MFLCRISPPTRRWTVVTIAAAQLALLGGVAVPAAHAEGTSAFHGSYVALGDSFSAGPGLPGGLLESGLCARARTNFPSLVAKQLAPSSFKDVSCTWAETKDMATSQLPFVAPQLDALTPDTGLVTLTIGGNDLGFAGIIVDCSLRGVFDQQGAPCRHEYTAGGSDALVRRITEIRPKLRGVLQAIRERAKNARVLMVGYPALLPDTKAKCKVGTPIAAGDVPYLDGIERRTNQMFAQEASAAGVDFVDTYSSSVGHDFCQTPQTRWAQGVLDFLEAAPVHPNSAGMRNMADRVLDRVKG